MENLKLTYSDLTIQESDLIFLGLRKLPMESVEELFKKLGYQAHLQLAAYNASKEQPKEEEPAQ